MFTDEINVILANRLVIALINLIVGIAISTPIAYVITFMLRYI